MARATIKDVAKKCGLSVATVSRVLGGTDYPVKAQTRQLILETAQQVGYVPNLLARSLKTRTGNEIAVIIPSIQNPFYTMLVKGVETALQGTAYNMLMYLTDIHSRSAQQLVNSLQGKMIAGVIIAADSMDAALHESLYTMQQNSGTPVLVIDYQLPDNKFPGVYFDYFTGAKLAAEYLLQKGHRRIVFATRPLDRETRQARLAGFRAAFAGLSLDYSNDCFECDGDSDYTAGIVLAGQIAACGVPYTAVVANNDSVAVGLLSGLSQRRIHVPSGISVIGFDDCIYAEMCNPMLTTVRVPSQHMGHLATKTLLDRLEGRDITHSVLLEPEIVERNSVINAYALV